MNQFYVSIIFLGIMLICITLIWIAYDKKKSLDYLKKLEEKKENLVEIINDAEQMVEELNKFSDYIVTQMDLKNEELCTNLKSIEERVTQINVKSHYKNEIKVLQNDKVVNGSNIDIQIDPDISAFSENYSFSSGSDSVSSDKSSLTNVHEIKPQFKVREKVIPLNSKYREVVNLSENGFDYSEIAKKLNMGKGEVQLIIEMNK